MARSISPNAARGYVRFPAISGDRIVFTAEDDLWLVSIEGGRAERLTAGVAEATHTRFSPDGQTLAFTGRDEGPAEVYVMPAEGGPSRRLTFQGETAAVAGWKPDGSAILFATAAGQARRGMNYLWAVSPEGGEPSQTQYGLASSIAFGPHGAVVLGRNTGDPARWKRYRGGTAGYFWVDATGGGEFKHLLDLRANMSNACWIGERVYFISDHEGIGCVYSCLPTGEDLRRHTAPSEFYARGLSGDGQRLVYHAGGDLYLLEPGAANSAKLDVEVAGSRAQRARKFVPAAQYLETATPAPKGRAVALVTRGKAFSMGNWDGAALQHGADDGARYRLATWLADGKRLVAVKDTGTDPQLVVLSVDGASERTLKPLDIGTVVELRAAPVGERVVLRNHRSQVVLVDLADESLRVLDHSPFGREEDLRRMHGLAWSPDGKWVAYSFRINGQQTAIKLAEVASGATHQVTEPVLYDVEPAFDPAGKYLYFVGARDFDPVEDKAQFEWSFPKTMRPYLVTLQRELRSPFVPEPEAPPDELKEKVAEAQAEQEQDQAPKGPPEVRVDLEGITRRAVAFPVSEGRYGRVAGTHEGVVFSAYPVEGTRHAPIMAGAPEANGTIHFYHFTTHKGDTLVDGVSDFEVTADGKTLLYRAGDKVRVIKAGEKPSDEGGDRPGRESGWIDLDRAKVSVDPKAEWRQMFGEAWRLQREQYWTPDMGGVDWNAIYARYAPLVDRLGSRAELSDLIWEMQGELGSSHAYEFGGEYRPHPEYRQGFLGVDWRYDAARDRYVIAHLVTGDSWDADSTSPLLAPGINVAEGDAVLAVNGQRVSRARSPRHLLVNQAKREVQLLIEPAAGGEARTVSVVTLADEHPARYRDWVNANRRAVHEATQGRVGYIHLPDMAYDGFAEFHRQYLTEFDHDGLIVDIRWNGGGMVSQLVLEKLARRRFGYDFQRWGQPTAYFKESRRGPVVALTDEHAGSDGDIFSHVYKMLGLGPLIGKRTWGGVVGIDPYVALVDGTVTTQPEFAFWFQDVGWGVENYGTDPTIEVDYAPQDYAHGRDPQLARGIEEALKLVAQAQTATPTPGPHPDRAYHPAGQ